MKQRSAPVIRLAALLALFFPALAAHASSRDTRGFEGIAFGTPRAEVIERLCVRLKIDKVQAFAGIEYRGPDGLRLLEEDEDVVLQRYRFDRLRTDAVLFFNVNQKFFRVQYEAQKRPSGYFETTIKDDVTALSRSFQKIYGAPTFQMEPRMSEMRPGSRSYFWRWTRGRDTVYTAVVADENDFGAVAVLSDDSYLREAPAARPEVALTPEPTIEATPTSTPDPSFVPAPDVGPTPVPSVP